MTGRIALLAGAAGGVLGVAAHRRFIRWRARRRLAGLAREFARYFEAVDEVVASITDEDVEAAYARCLASAGLGPRDAEEATRSFTCPRCGMTSHNPNDVAQGYCGNCHDFTADPVPAP